MLKREIYRDITTKLFASILVRGYSVRYDQGDIQGAIADFNEAIRLES
jgi:hypothetical protein